VKKLLFFNGIGATPAGPQLPPLRRKSQKEPEKTNGKFSYLTLRLTGCGVRSLHRIPLTFRTTGFGSKLKSFQSGEEMSLASISGQANVAWQSCQAAH
jgi:hypothetical protein